jgi:folate-binding protein YgfZ
MTVAVAAPTREDYTLLKQDAGLVDRSNRTRLTFSGPQAAAALTGLVTNDVLELLPEHGQYAAALTPKGKVLADLRIFHRTDATFLVDIAPAAAAGFTAMVKKYVNPRLAKYEDVSASLACFGVVGPHARQVVAHALTCAPAAFDLLPAFAHTAAALGDAPVLVARAPDHGVDAFDCFVAATAAMALRDALSAAGAGTASPEALEVLRIEAGRPLWGADMDDETLAQEARLDVLDAISYTKGCYTGQEVVARVHFRGHVNRLLRGLRAASLPSEHARVLVDDADVGEVRSRAVSPHHGPIALAMMRREIDAGAAVTLRGTDGDVRATVVDLPFPA